MFHISGAEPIQACSSMMLSHDPKFGGNARKHRRSAGRHDVQLTANRYGDRFCKGRGSIFVSERKDRGRSRLGVRLASARRCSISESSAHRKPRRVIRGPRKRPFVFHPGPGSRPDARASREGEGLARDRRTS